MDRVCTTERERARRPFVIAPNREDRGDVRPDRPKRCPWSQGGACRIRVQRWRLRKTGPGFPLCVVECVTHARIFTLYPPGHVPYGRVAMAPVASDGQRVRDDKCAGDAWEMTLFRAVLDAARGVAWPRRLAPGDGERGQESWRTQGRRIVLAASLLGVLAEAERAQPAIALELGIPTLVVRDAALLVASVMVAHWGRAHCWDPGRGELRSRGPP